MRMARFHRWAPLLLVVITLGTYAPLMGHSFTLMDDPRTLTENPRFNPPTWGAIGYYWTHPHMELWVPVTYSVWGVLAMGTYVATPDEWGVHLDARVYHAASVLAHAGAA